MERGRRQAHGTACANPVPQDRSPASLMALLRSRIQCSCPAGGLEPLKASVPWCQSN